MNLVDKTIAIFSPKLAFRRENYRQALELKRSYNAASRSKRNKGWKATGSSANTEIGHAASILRARSRELIRNNSYAKKANKAIVNNTIGTGIRPSTTEKNKSASEKIKNIWVDWAETKQIDYYGKRNFYSIQKMVMRTIAQSGACIIRFMIERKKDSVIPFTLQVLEPDYIDTSKDGQMYGSNEIRQGIEFNSKDQKVAYWMFKQHPGDNRIRFELNSIRISAEEILHIYEEERPGQIHGVPFGASTMLKLRDLDDYEDAELIRQKIAACFTAFVSNSADGKALSESSDNNEVDRLEPGRVEYLAPGEEVVFGSPSESQNQDYKKHVLHSIAAGFGVSYEAMTGDLKGVNFSSGRMGWLEFQRQITDWQLELIVPQLCEAVWDKMMDFLVLLGNVRKKSKATWTLPRREMIEPAKEIKALLDQIRNGLISFPDAIQQMGGDPEVVMAEIEKSNELIDKYKLVLDSDPRSDIKRVEQNNLLKKPANEGK